MENAIPEENISLEVGIWHSFYFPVMWFSTIGTSYLKSTQISAAGLCRARKALVSHFLAVANYTQSYSRIHIYLHVKISGLLYV